ncbi:alpha/beta hydrolase [Actinospica sp. MGRD01-02]|uniref:Alpha/beta hydrolase n=1 Tax=Actinospica acidithermotolerans TaxID=2828514 RepID=A0A941IH94_9ACTN|nr:alpha/beta hydrolase [Actinospica acidithermotolerans]MBR7825477.1 alpha/beta hydrolase [Actinospica acidithermotolerans]
MAVESARNGPVDLAYETVGPPGGEPLLLIMGLDSPMRWWPDGFCAELADRGFTVARFDNRDTGRSTRTAGRPCSAAGRAGAGYSALDMIEDARAVLDALAWPDAHVVGQSMGASIAIGLGLHHPGRVRTVTTLSALPRGFRLAEVARYVDPVGLARMARVTARRPRTRQQLLRQHVALARMQAAGSQPFDERWATETARQVLADGPSDPAASARQLAAIRTGSRLLRHPERLGVPLLAIHGAEDPLVRPSAAAALARAVPGGRAIVFGDMGHEVPRRLWPALADAISRNASRARILAQ